MSRKAERKVEHGEKVVEKKDRMLEHGFSSERAVVEVARAVYSCQLSDDGEIGALCLRKPNLKLEMW